jgi:ABC transporter substrate binding protein (PQQ-dependent alcohol dehydrogenase system)
VAAGATVLLCALDDAGTAALMAASAGLRVPVLNLTASADALRAGCASNAFHVAPSRAMLADAVALWIVANSTGKAVVIVSGDAESGALGDRVQAHIGGRTGGIVRFRYDIPEGTKAPDLPRQRDAVVLTGGGEEEVVAAEWTVPDVPLVDLSGGGAVPRSIASRAARGLVVRPVGWHPSLERFGGDQLNRRFRLKAGRAMDGAAWAGWAAVKIATEAAMRAASDTTAGLAEHLVGRRAEFDAQKGWPLSFRPWDHQLRQPLYIAAADADRIAGEQPSGRGEDGDSAAALDTLGDSVGDRRCAGSAS